ncbi:MAG TPA: cytochrome c [Rhodospirillales bacterium]|jgi:mono/diheme cytochrome c family protein|nr:cytochrome c [Rhodospirillales bacterium]
MVSLNRLCATAMLVFAVAAPPVAADEAVLVRGKYLFDAAGCHTDSKNKGPLAAGGRALKTPFGVFFSPNITPHDEHGIGAWSEDDLARPLRHGVSPDGAHYFPVFPYPSYTGISDADLGDLGAYIFSRPAVARRNRPHQAPPPFGWRFLVPVWKWLNFTPGPLAPGPKRDAARNRGAYLVEALAHCGQCHTPRNVLGARKSAMKPDFDFVGAAMGEVVANTTSRLTDTDLAAVITCLRSLPPVRHRVRRKKRRTRAKRPGGTQVMRCSLRAAPIPY